MFRSLLSDGWQIFWLAFHVALGLGCVYSKWPIIIWFYVFLLSFFFSFFTTKRSSIQNNLIYVLAYSLTIEVLARGVGATPFIPDQLGKYMGVFVFGFGLALGGPIKKVSLYGSFLLLLSLPALAIAPDYSRKQIVFNYFGPLSLYLGVIFCSKQIMTFKEMKQLMRILVYPIISLAFFTIFKAAQFEKIEYGLTANFESSGGSISNQVSTLFGLGICLITLMLLTGQQLFKFKILDVSFILLFAIRGLLTFSRGGMISALIAILAVVLFPKAKAAWQDNEVTLRRVKLAPVLLGALLLIGAFIAINAYTNNYLLYRYQGKTERSLRTGFQNTENLNQITSGRMDVFYSDLNMFVANPAIGVGVGQSALLREEYDGPPGHAAHLELSRLLAEHGIPGMIIVIMMFIVPFFRAAAEPNNYRKVFILVMLIMGLSVTFHSAMRTMITPLLFAFAFINFVPTNYDWKTQLAGLQEAKRTTKRKMEARRKAQLAS